MENPRKLWDLNSIIEVWNSELEKNTLDKLFKH